MNDQVSQKALKLHVANVLLGERPYKPTWSFDKAKGDIREQIGRHFDPACMESLLNDQPKSTQSANASQTSPPDCNLFKNCLENLYSLCLTRSICWRR